MAEAVLAQRRTLSLSVAAMLAAMLPVAATAQQAEATARQHIWLTAYGLYSHVNPDYMTDRDNNGVTFGGDIDALRILPRTRLGLDARYSYSTGNLTNQQYFGGGPRVSVHFGRFKPYGDFLFGHGKGIFNHSGDPNYTQDSTGALTYGGGLDFQVTRSWAVRGDIQRERWRYSHLTPFFYPVEASVGLSYQFHFHGRTGPNL